MSEGYRNVNRANWDERAPAHAASLDYALEKFRTDPSHLSDIVRFDLPPHTYTLQATKRG